jgi:hypothetical protein
MKKPMKTHPTESENQKNPTSMKIENRELKVSRTFPKPE